MTDRLERCKQCATPGNLQRVCIEMQDLQQEITDLRSTLY